MIHYTTDPKTAFELRARFLLAMSDEAADRLPLATWRERQRLVDARSDKPESLSVKKA